MNTVYTVKQWFNQLAKREQIIVMIAAALIVVYLLYGVLYLNLVKSRDQYANRVNAAESTLSWMTTAVKTIKAGRQAGAATAVTDQSLSQLAETAAKGAGIRLTRFQPKDEHEAQAWFDRVDFTLLLDFLNRLEIGNGVLIEELSINSANTPGIVNVRIKFSK